MDVLESKLTWLLNIAERIQTHFKSQSQGLLKVVQSVCEKNGGIVAYNKIASEGYSFMIIAEDPKHILHIIIDELKAAKSSAYQQSFNPISIIMKLIDKEYMLDVNGTRLCYCIKSPFASNALMKSIACKNISSVRYFYEFADEQSGMLQASKIGEVDPAYDYNSDSRITLGGKKQIFRPKEKKKINVRTQILSRLFEYVRKNGNISSGIIFVNSLQESSESAINIIYTQYKFNEAIVDYFKLLIAKEFPNYKFKKFLHSDFSIPYDFKMKKYSCLINDRHTGAPTYLANLYNIAEYTPIPCTKSIIQNTFVQMAHPIIKLRLLYIDIFIVEQRTNSTKHESVFSNKLLKAIAEVYTYDKNPTWVGYFIDEAYEKIKFNMQMQMTDPINIVLI